MKLYIAATAFQVWIILRLAVTTEEKKDLLLIRDHIGSVEKLKKRLEDTLLFSNVYVMSVDECTLTTKLLHLLRFDIINDYVINSTFDIGQYNEIYINHPPVLKILKKMKARLAKWFPLSLQELSKINFFDEGSSSYLWSLMEWRMQGLTGNKVYLAKPTLADYYETYKSLISLPSLGDTEELSRLYQYVYGEENAEVVSSFQGVLFFDQPYANEETETFVKKLLIAVLKECGVCCVKLHPRSESQKADWYRSFGCTVQESVDDLRLWETTLCSQTSLDKLLLLTISSTAVCSHLIYLDMERLQIPILFAYPWLAALHSDKRESILEINPDLGKFFKRVGANRDMVYYLHNEKDLLHALHRHVE